jgi:hypothetical protein
MRDLESAAHAIAGPSSARDFADRVRVCAEELHAHTRAEEQSVFPALASRAPGAEAPYLHDHHDEDVHLAEIIALAEQVAAGEGGDTQKRLARETSVLVGEDQSATFSKMMMALAPVLPRALPWIVKRLEPAMQVEFLSAMQRSVPPPAFVAFTGMVRVGVEASLWADLETRMPALAAKPPKPSLGENAHERAPAVARDDR